MVCTMDNFRIVSLIGAIIIALSSESSSVKAPGACQICHCHKDKVDCSGRNLRKIPELPKTTSYLNFNNNNISELSKNVLKTVPDGMKQMAFSNCNIKRISDSDLLVRFQNLTTFHIGANKVDKKSLENIFRSVNSSNVKSLDVSGNNLKPFQHELNFSLLSKLKDLIMNDCNISSLSSILQTNASRDFKNLELQRNFIGSEELQSFIEYGAHYSKLQLLKLASNPIENVPSNTFSKLTNLRRLFISKVGIKKSVFQGLNSSKLIFLDITDSFTLTTTKSKDVFKMTPDMSTLNISETNLSSWTEMDLKHLFSPMKSLGALALSQTSLKTVPCDSFKIIANLHSLDISGNQINSWSETCFKGMPRNVTVLYLNRNRITNINKTSFPSEFTDNLRRLHLYDNKFRCNCQIHWFRDWMKKNYGKLGIPDHDYRCASPARLKGTLLVNYDPDYEICNGTSTYEVVAIGIAGFATVFIVTVLVLKKFASIHRKKGYTIMKTRETMFD